MAPSPDAAAEPQSDSQTSAEAGRADTLSLADPYRLQLTDAELDLIKSWLGEKSLHSAVGLLTAAVTIPEPLSWDEVVLYLSSLPPESIDDVEHSDENDIDEDEDALDEDESEDLDEVFDEDESEDLDVDDLDEGEGQGAVSASPNSPEVLQALKVLLDRVQQRIADGEVASLVPVEADAKACDAWICGFESAVCATLHDPTEEESDISLRVFADFEGNRRVSRAERKALARRSLAADVTRLIELWREVPPYDPEQEDLRWSDVVPMRDDVLTERGIHSGGTYVRAEPKVGRNDLCPCGSGKKYKKCCG